jgi:hypothetical protein
VIRPLKKQGTYELMRPIEALGDGSVLIEAMDGKRFVQHSGKFRPAPDGEGPRAA